MSFSSRRHRSILRSCYYPFEEKKMFGNKLRILGELYFVKFGYKLRILLEMYRFLGVVWQQLRIITTS
jgi:hypothetical protein